MKPTVLLSLLFLIGIQTSALSIEAPKEQQSFDLANGFKPAQRDLTAIFLQIADSLEYYGSPEPYLRHMAKEHERINAKYQQQLGKTRTNSRPANLTDEYLELLSRNWNHLASNIELASLAKEVGHDMRIAINGTEGNGTEAAEILRKHQVRTLNAMAGKGGAPAGFEVLRVNLTTTFKLDETAPTSAEKSLHSSDAIHAVSNIRAMILALYKRLDEGLKPTDAERVKTMLNHIFLDVGATAQSELEAGIAERALDDFAAYDATKETELNDAERKQFALFLAKDRFTRSDFPALDKFYGGTAYDKLSQRGKDEMSLRLWAGMKPKN